MEENKVLLEVQDLQQYFPVAGRRGKFVRAVDGVSFAIWEGETFGLVGESGCGKSTLARTVIRINKPTGGRIAFDGLEITNLSQKDLKGSGLRQRMQMVFQDPYSSLNSRMTVRDALMEPLIANQIGENDAQREEMAREALGRVNLSPDYIHPTSSPADSASASALPGRSSSSPRWSSATRPSPPWMCPSRPRWSICWGTSSRSWG